MSDPVIRGFHSAVLSDMLTHRQINVERLKTAMHGSFDAVTRDVYNALLQALADNRVTQFNHTNATTLRRIVTAVLKRFDVASHNYVTNVTRFLMTYTKDEADFYETAIRRVIVVPDSDEQAVYTEDDTWGFFAPLLIGATGYTATQSIKRTVADARHRIQGTLQQAHVLNLTTNELLASLQGTAAALEKDGLFRRLRNAAASIVDTVVQAGMSAARLQVIKRLMDYITGYTWVSVLDSRTSAVCRSLSGQIFEYGKGPIPPMHYRCRSHIEPIFSLRAVMRAGAGAVFTAGETYYEWMRKQPAALQDEVLGPTRGAIFRKGGLTASQFAVMVLNRRYQPLTLDELRKKNPEIFARAGV